MTINQRIRAVLLVAVAGFALVGCAPVDVPDPEPSASPTPSASAEPAAAAVYISATGFTVVDESDETVATALYSSDPQAAIAILTDAFGSEPELSVRPSDLNCVPEANVVSWDGFALRYGIPVNSVPRGQLFEVESTAATVAGLSVETPGGASVGDPVGDVAAGLPAEQVGEPVTTDLGLIQSVAYEIGSGTYVPWDHPEFGSYDFWGASARSIDGMIDRLDAPVLLQNQC
ncbi:hypothetical protein [Conyzicola nivalis]|nr:hypothetical protein [Conyzicola nivalis]